MRNSLQMLRKAQKLTLSELSDKCGIPVSTISSFENGKRRITDYNLIRLAKALDVEPEEILQPPFTLEVARKAMVREEQTSYGDNLATLISRIAKILCVPEERVRDAVAELLKTGGGE